MDRLWEERARRFAALHREFLAPGARVLDIGAGNGRFARALRRSGILITGVDVKDYNATGDPVTLYDGRRLPFDANSFDAVIINSVLHHCDDPDGVLNEALRVSRGRLQVLEDIYSNRLGLQFLKFNDWLTNVPFGQACPFRFRTDAGWKEAWRQLGLELFAEREMRSLLRIARFKLYVLRKR
jgi:ubiquinone/menaquinone biosynthesis C-methylase UbiE